MKQGAPWWIAVSYAVYVLVWCMFVIGGTAYVVFWKDQSGWWFALAICLSPWKPYKWHDLWIPDRERIKEEQTKNEKA